MWVLQVCVGVGVRMRVCVCVLRACGWVGGCVFERDTEKREERNTVLYVPESPLVNETLTSVHLHYKPGQSSQR